MKVLTVRQPWASLIVSGIKDVENRSKATNYRGRIGIHAGQKVNDDAMRTYGHLLPPQVAIGALLGTVEIIECQRGMFSDWALPDHWHWVLAQPRRLRRPVPMTGHLGLWNYAGSLGHRA